MADGDYTPCLKKVFATHSDETYANNNEIARSNLGTGRITTHRSGE